MVREHQHGGVIVQRAADFAQHLIDLLIKLGQRRTVLGGQRSVVFRMLRIDQPPEHVRIQIEAGKIKEEQAGVEFGKLGVENLAMFRQHCARLLQIFLVVEHAGGEGLGVFGNALGVELAYFFRELARITLRSGNAAARDRRDRC